MRKIILEYSPSPLQALPGDKKVASYSFSKVLWNFFFPLKSLLIENYGSLI